ncbi:MAG TPA: hypothetical protein VEQ65_00250, partial [Opitutus sp.]|nr:hypothetical protein [Opitutus sp.]
RRTTAGSGGGGDTPPPPPVLAVTKLVLVDAAGQRDLRELTPGSTISLSQDGAALNVRAEVNGAAGSVSFALNGSFYRVENIAPYALGADDAGVYRAWRPSPGNLRIRATPYSGGDRGGTVGTPLELTLNVVQ